MKVTCHLASNDFYYSTQMAGAVSLEQHGIKCPDERLDCVRLHLETPQFMCQSCPESHLWRLCYQHSLNHQTATHRGSDWPNCLTLSVFTLCTIASVHNQFQLFPSVLLSHYFLMCRSPSIINMWQHAFKCS